MKGQTAEEEALFGRADHRHAEEIGLFNKDICRVGP